MAMKLVLLHVRAGLQPVLANKGGDTFGPKGSFCTFFMRILGRFVAKFVHPNTPAIAENNFENLYPLAIRASVLKINFGLPTSSCPALCPTPHCVDPAFQR